MAGHWTYEIPEQAANLEQGDILQPTAALRKIFSEVHPHFCQDKYLAFLIATQSCDLVVRHSAPKASYINLAAVRPLSQVIYKIFANVAEPAGNGVFRASKKSEGRRVIERLLNQNEQSIGLFFLYPDADAGIAEPAVAFLRVTVALRADHYETLRAARIGRLGPTFRAKLGWLIGNLYVRPATPDWADHKGGQKAFDDLVRQFTGEARWIDDEILDKASAAGVDLTTASPEALETFRPPSRIDRALDELERELTQVAPDLDTERLIKLKNRLRNNGKFTKLFK